MNRMRHALYLRGARAVLIAAVASAVSVALNGCATPHGMSDAASVHLDRLSRAVCVLTPTAGNTAHGVVTFEQHGSSVIVTADLDGLAPNSEHAWHIHEYGDATATNGTAMGGHYNPEGHPHGLPPDPNRHAGDFGNLTADATGHAHAVLTVRNITIGGALNPILGRGMIIHAKKDDGGQPTGNAGARIAQGVIGVEAPPK